MNRSARLFLVFLSFATALSISACSGGSAGSGGTTQNPTTPVVAVMPASSSITAAQSLSVSITVSGSSGTPTGLVVLSSGTYGSPAATLSSGSATISIPAGSLAKGADTLTAKYTPDSSSSSTYNSASGTASVTVAAGLATPTVTVTPEETTHAYAQNLIVTTAVAGTGGTPTGNVTLSSGSFTSVATSLNNGSATFYVQPGWLAQGTDTLTVTYTPDSSSSSKYASTTGTQAITISAPGSTSVAVTINTLGNRHLISPYIYGINTLTPSDITNLSPKLARFGGNETSDYNWKLLTYNSGSDYYFSDFGLGGVDSVQLTKFAVGSGSQMLTTMPMLGWVAQASGWSYSVKKYGAQCSVAPSNSDAGNGQKPDCSTRITTGPVTDAYYPLVATPSDCPTGTTDGTTCLDRQTWAQALASAFGNSTCIVPYSPITSCHFYDMDNEPEIWAGPHGDVHPSGTGYSELSNLFVTEGTQLKTWDPSAVRFGPITCCYNFLWSAGTSGDDRSAHAGIDFVPWWLNQVNWLDQINGTRTLDVFDIHAYFGDNISTSGYTNPQLRIETNKYLRTYWDPTYYNSGDDQSWMTTTQPNRGVTFLIPRLKALANATYPGTPLAFTEWESFFNEWEFATALSDADAYGVMGREGLSFSTRWGGPSATDSATNQPHPNYQSFKLYTNYDGAKHGFGTLSVSDQSSANPDLFVSYAALDVTGTTMTIMVLNKDPGNTANVTFNLNGFSATTYTTYTVASTNPGSITSSASTAWSATQSFAANTITLLVVSGSQSSKPDSEWYLNPDDLMVPASGTGILQPAITSGTAPVTLTSAVFDAFEGALACSGTLTLTNATITPTTPATITVNPGSTVGFCHYTVTGSDGISPQTQGGWIVVGQPAGTLASQSGNSQSGSTGTALAQPLTVTLTPAAGTTFTTNGASVLFTTSAGTLSNGTTSGAKVMATTNSSGVASVTLTLPSTKGTVTVTAQDQVALGGASVTFTEIAN
jgi:Glycoside hydrolase family 44